MAQKSRLGFKPALANEHHCGAYARTSLLTKERHSGFAPLVPAALGRRNPQGNRKERLRKSPIPKKPNPEKTVAILLNSGIVYMVL
jgi:hypothetical protein